MSIPQILIVDDAPLIRGLMVQVLKKNGYNVETAENGQQAIESVMRNRPDLILMDADMPVLDGVAACARIKLLPDTRHLPIIIVTSFMEGEWVDRAYAAGAIDYVTKPVNWDVLRNRIHYILTARQAEEALFEEKEKALVTLASIGDGVITTDAQGHVEFLNPVASRLTGWSNSAAKGLPLSEVFAIYDEKRTRRIEFPIQNCLDEGRIMAMEGNIILSQYGSDQYYAIEDSAAPIKDRDGHIIGVVLVFHDVTETRKMTQELSYKAKHDALTELYNLHEFKSRLNHLLGQLSIQKQHSLLYMDLDQFKIVNDTCGHEAGDQLLKDVAMLLQQQVDQHQQYYENATMARLGGDEFGLLLENCSLENTMLIANQMRVAIEQYRFYWRNEKQEKSIFAIGVSLGLVPITSQTPNQKTLLAMADAACYAAKNAGRNNVHLYQENDAELLGRHKEIQWVSLINDNLERIDGFTLYFQLIVPLVPQNGNSLIYEVLLRMRDTTDQWLSPGAFLSAAGRHNLMPMLDRWVLGYLLEQFSKNPHHLERLQMVNINISGYSLNDRQFLEFVIEQINNFWIPAHKLCFEITETTAITNLAGAIKFIKALKLLGCSFALDDFGSGMSSMLELKELPVDFVKLDGQLVRNISSDPVDLAMLRAVNDIAHLMGIRTIAESVENAETLEQLKKSGVDFVQGYHIMSPAPLNMDNFSIHTSLPTIANT